MPATGTPWQVDLTAGAYTVTLTITLSMNPPWTGQSVATTASVQIVGALPPLHLRTLILSRRAAGLDALQLVGGAGVDRAVGVDLTTGGLLLISTEAEIDCPSKSNWHSTRSPRLKPPRDRSALVIPVNSRPLTRQL